MVFICNIYIVQKHTTTYICMYFNRHTSHHITHNIYQFGMNIVLARRVLIASPEKVTQYNIRIKKLLSHHISMLILMLIF